MPESIITLHKDTVLKLLELVKDLSLLCLSNRKCSSHKAVAVQRKMVVIYYFLGENTNKQTKNSQYFDLLN